MNDENYVLRWHWHAFRGESKLAALALLNKDTPRIAWALHSCSARFFNRMLNEINAMYQERALKELRCNF